MRMLFISAWALGALTSLALAEEPVALTDAQMDAVTAGQHLVSDVASSQVLTQIGSAIAIGGAGGDGGRGGDANGDFDCGSCNFGDGGGDFAGAGGLGGLGGDGGIGGNALAIVINSASMTQTITR